MKTDIKIVIQNLSEIQQQLDSLQQQINSLACLGTTINQSINNATTITSMLSQDEYQVHDHLVHSTSHLHHSLSSLKRILKELTTFRNQLDATTTHINENEQKIVAITDIIATCQLSAQHLIDELSLCATTQEQLHKNIEMFSETKSSAPNNNDQTTKIIALFNDIATKTNLLAINTAIIAQQGEAKHGSINVIAKELQSLATQIKYGAEQLGVTAQDPTTNTPQEQKTRITQNLATLSTHNNIIAQTSQALIKTIQDLFKLFTEEKILTMQVAQDHQQALQTVEHTCDTTETTLTTIQDTETDYHGALNSLTQTQEHTKTEAHILTQASESITTLLALISQLTTEIALAHQKTQDIAHLCADDT